MKLKNFSYNVLLLVLTMQFCNFNTMAQGQKLKTGVYFNEKYPESYFALKFKNDSTFYLVYNYGSELIGNYKSKGDSLILITEKGWQIAFQSKSGFLIDSEGEKWFLWKGGNTRSAYVKEKGLWLYIFPGQIKGDFELTKFGELFYDSKKIGEFDFVITQTKLMISPSSTRKSIALCLFVLDKGPQKVFLLDMKNKKVLANDLSATVDWISWSPRENYAVTAALQYEKDMSLYIIDVTKDKITESYVPMGLAKEREWHIIDLESLKWISPKIFQVRVNIICNYYAYEDEPPPENCGEDILRSYDVQVNVSTLEVSSRRIK